MQVRLAGANPESVTDGEGVRAVVYFQGCQHDCSGCHNPDTHPLQGGYLADTEVLLQQLMANPLVAGLTISGGEPFLQPEAALALASGAKALGKTVWLYTGFCLEELISQPVSREVLRVVDVLIDGRFVLTERDLTLAFRGSRNQRILHSHDWLNVIQ